MINFKKIITIYNLDILKKDGEKATLFYSMIRYNKYIRRMNTQCE